MFICEKCAPKEVKWLFDLSMGISYGNCEQCRQKAECIDLSENFVIEENLTESNKYQRGKI